jgi:hypothetical protein
VDVRHLTSPAPLLNDGVPQQHSWHRSAGNKPTALRKAGRPLLLCAAFAGGDAALRWIALL